MAQVYLSSDPQERQSIQTSSEKVFLFYVPRNDFPIPSYQIIIEHNKDMLLTDN